ncbi:MAG: peptidoglycan-binding protein [Bacteroidia bacterium]|nr:peptidoglycan-binding protein [Bacteroidia bacterium]
MKNLFFLVIIITLPLIAFFQFQNWRKFHPPKDYTEVPSQEIDPNYHDSETVLNYYTSLQQAATYARYCWKEHRVDVRSDYPADSKKQIYLKTYQNYLGHAQMLKQKLINSADWKKQGYSNEEIKILESEGELPFDIKHLLTNKVVAKIGDENQLVYEVQKKLVNQGYTMPIDGVFKSETQEALKTFQNDQELFPSGILDRLTLEKLYQLQNQAETQKDSLDQN